MSQLKMYWLSGTPIANPELPEGYSLSNYADERDRAAWVDCCRQGLVADDADDSAFVSRIEEHDDIDLFYDVIFLDYGSKHIGTVTAVYHKSKNCGEIHMVGIHPDFRGRGLGKYLNAAALNKLNAQGARYVYLTTDEWRKSAVKSYLSSGLLPVEYDEGMEERWRAVITEHGIDSVDMVNEDCSFCRTISKQK